MRAAVLIKPGHIEIQQRPIPSPSPDEILVRIACVGVCGSDIPRILTYGAYHPRLTLGHEFSGVIAQTGEMVDQWRMNSGIWYRLNKAVSLSLQEESV